MSQAKPSRPLAGLLAFVLATVMPMAGCGSGGGVPRLLAITGFVTDAAMRTPLPGTVASAQGQTATADASGFFVLQDLAGGRVQLTLSHAGYRPLVLQVSLTGGSVALGKVYLSPLHVAGTGDVQGRVTVGGAPAVGALVLIGTAQAQTDERGEFIVFNAPAGLQTLTAASADRGRLGYLQVTVPADGELRGVSVVLQGGPPPPPL